MHFQENYAKYKTEITQNVLCILHKENTSLFPSHIHLAYYFQFIFLFFQAIFTGDDFSCQERQAPQKQVITLL